MHICKYLFSHRISYGYSGYRCLRTASGAQTNSSIQRRLLLPASRALSYYHPGPAVSIIWCVTIVVWTGSQLLTWTAETVRCRPNFQSTAYRTRGTKWKKSHNQRKSLSHLKNPNGSPLQIWRDSFNLWTTASSKECKRPPRWTDHKASSNPLLPGHQGTRSGL